MNLFIINFFSYYTVLLHYFVEFGKKPVLEAFIFGL